MKRTKTKNKITKNDIALTQFQVINKSNLDVGIIKGGPHQSKRKKLYRKRKHKKRFLSLFYLCIV